MDDYLTCPLKFRFSHLLKIPIMRHHLVIYGSALPGNMTATIMSGNVTGGIGLHAADLLTGLGGGLLAAGEHRRDAPVRIQDH